MSKTPKTTGLLAHHASYLIGTAAMSERLIKILADSAGLVVQGNPDLFERKYETLTIDDARELRSAAEMRPVTDAGVKYFVLTMNGITVEAQNALLKLLEEPPEYARFFLVVPSAHLLLPTVRSRMALIEAQKLGVGSQKPEARSQEPEVRNFVGASQKERLEFIKKLMDDISKEKRPKQDALDFLNELEAAIHAKGAKENAEALRAIEKARTYMYDRAPSLKMLLEYVSLAI